MILHRKKLTLFIFCFCLIGILFSFTAISATTPNQDDRDTSQTHIFDDLFNLENTFIKGVSTLLVSLGLTATLFIIRRRG